MEKETVTTVLLDGPEERDSSRDVLIGKIDMWEPVLGAFSNMSPVIASVYISPDYGVRFVLDEDRVKEYNESPAAAIFGQQKPMELFIFPWHLERILNHEECRKWIENERKQRKEAKE